MSQPPALPPIRSRLPWIRQGKTYDLQVQALSGDAVHYVHSESSPTATLIIPAKLGTPNQPSSSGNLDDGYTISWNAIPNAAGYQLRWRVQSTPDWPTDTRANTTGATSYEPTGLQQGTTYEFQVKALDGGSAYYEDSGFSPTETLIVPTRLDTPNQPTVSSGSLDAGYAVSWNSIPNASDYRLQWRVQGTLPWSDVVASTGGATSHTIIPTAAQQGATYDLQVQALNSDTTRYVHSGFSPTATLIVPTRLNTPNQPTSSGNLDDGYTISWNTIPNAAGYQLRWRVQSTPDWPTDTRANTTGATSYEPTGLQQGTTYEFQVKALDGGSAYL